MRSPPEEQLSLKTPTLVHNAGDAGNNRISVLVEKADPHVVGHHGKGILHRKAGPIYGDAYFAVSSSVLQQLSAE